MVQSGSRVRTRMQAIAAPVSSDTPIDLSINIEMGGLDGLALQPGREFPTKG